MGRKETFKSTEDLLAGMGLSPEVTESIAKTIGNYSLAQKLTLLRVRAGLTSKELAAKSGLSTRDISRIETTPNELQKLKAIAAYAKAFDHEIIVTLRRRGKAANMIRPAVRFEV